MDASIQSYLRAAAAGVERTRRMLDGGGVAVLARAGGEAVGWGQTTPPRQGATELVGIAERAYARAGFRPRTRMLHLRAG